MRISRVFVAAYVMSALAFAPTLAQDLDLSAPEPPSGLETKQAVVATREMVVAANPLAARAGAAILRQGGSAADAAITTMLVLGLVEPQSAGLGGGGFLLHFDAARDELVALDGRETASRRVTGDMLLGPDGKPLGLREALTGTLTVLTQSLAPLLEETHKRWGKVKWRDLFTPAIRLAEQGFAISPRLAALIKLDRERLARDPVTAAYFLNQDGSPKQAGTILKNPEYAATLRAIAEEGAKAFTTGAIAQDIVERVNRDTVQPGRLSLDDLRDYRVLARAVPCIDYRETRICSQPAPSAGSITLLQTMKLLEPYDLGRAPNNAQGVHYFVEASKVAFADRGVYIADPDFAAVPQDALLADSYLAQRRALIRADGALKTPVPPGELPAAEKRAETATPDVPGTTHFSIVDKDGNAVALTATVQDVFGSRIMVRGFLLNNQLVNFSALAERDGKPVLNRIEPGKRPLSAMAPTMVFDRASGDLLMLMGAPGGTNILGYIAHTLIAVIDWNLDMQQAINLPRVVNRNGKTDLEAGTKAEALQAPLEALGHEVNVRALNTGQHGILIRNGKLIGGADPRREGAAVGR
jgi:gamma-glutamyltranspeptidase/glutathione hydrolase